MAYHMKREEYIKQCRENKKALIKQLIDIFFVYDGDYKVLGEKINKSKATVSTLLNSNDLIEEMIEEGMIEKEQIKQIKEKIDKNKEIGRKKGGDNFKEKYDVEFNDEHRIVSHSKK